MPAGMILALWLCQIGDSSCRLVHSSTTSLHQIQQRCCYFDERDVLVIDHPRLSTSRLSRRALVVLVAFAAHVMRLTRVVYCASCIVKLAWASCVKASCVKHHASSIMRPASCVKHQVVALRQCVLFPVCICYKNTCGASSCECNNENTFNTRVLTIVAFSIRWEGWWVEARVDHERDWSYGGLKLGWMEWSLGDRSSCCSFCVGLKSCNYSALPS